MGNIPDKIVAEAFGNLIKLFQRIIFKEFKQYITTAEVDFKR